MSCWKYIVKTQEISKNQAWVEGLAFEAALQPHPFPTQWYLDI